MKRLVFIIITFFFVADVVAQEMQFETGNWQSILDKAKKDKKLIFVDCSTVWCKPCKWMEKNVFTTNKVGTFFNANFLNVKMDMEKGEGIELRKKYNINAYPTFLFLDSDGKVIHKDGGAKDEDNFLAVAATALDPSQNLAAMHLKYEAGDRSKDFLRSYIPALGRAHLKVKQQEVFDKYFQLALKKDLFNEGDYNVLMSIAQPGDSAFLFVLENHVKYKKLVGGQKYDAKMYAKFIVPFSQMVYKNELQKLKSEAEKYKIYYPLIVQKAEDMAMVRWYRENKMTEELSKASIEFVKKYAENDTDDIFYCMSMILNGKDMEATKYKDALQLTANIYQKFPENYSIGDVYAGLLFKSGKLTEATSEAKHVLSKAPVDKQENLWSKKFLDESMK